MAKIKNGKRLEPWNATKATAKKYAAHRALKNTIFELEQKNAALQRQIAELQCKLPHPSEVKAMREVMHKMTIVHAREMGILHACSDALAFVHRWGIS